MKRIRIDKRNEEGMALLVATIFILVALIALAALSHRVLSQSHRVDSHIQLKECLQGLEFALAESKAELEGGWNGHIGLDGWEFSGEWNPAEE
ncbi:MAG TPA: hypothetical protein HPP77_06225, partial [Candidatus Hydrogenedentes bacterium]|nr:hypothetical protein [Candidatus Hydrogenedentota bacterium]